MEHRFVADEDQEAGGILGSSDDRGLGGFPAKLEPAQACAGMAIGQPPVPDPLRRGCQDFGEGFLALRPEEAPKVPAIILYRTPEKPGKVARRSLDLPL
ncbi:MAG: hypothetical protein ACOYM2_02655 [Rectinemataceae bacterium]